jgi:hypothetical protein
VLQRANFIDISGLFFLDCLLTFCFTPYTSFVIFKLLKNKITDYQLHLDKHHWGEKKISTRNLIVLTYSKPKEEFEYVKILTLNELLGYIQYFKPTLSNNETQKITDYLLTINNQKVIETVRN